MRFEKVPQPQSLSHFSVSCRWGIKLEGGSYTTVVTLRTITAVVSPTCLFFCLGCIFRTANATSDFIHSGRTARPPALVVEIDFRQINYPPAVGGLRELLRLTTCRTIRLLADANRSSSSRRQPSSTDDGGPQLPSMLRRKLIVFKTLHMARAWTVDYVRVYLVILNPSEVNPWQARHVGRRAISWKRKRRILLLAMLSCHSMPTSSHAPTHT